MDEIWKPVFGWEDLYEASNLGRIRSKPRRYWKPDPKMKKKGCWQNRPSRIMKTPCNGEGYPHTRLSKDGKCYSYKAHRLVWEAFNGPVPDGWHVDHIDGSRDNNRLDNLQAIDPKNHSIETVRRQVDGEYFPEEGKRWSEAYNKGYEEGFKAGQASTGVIPFHEGLEKKFMEEESERVGCYGFCHGE